MTRIEGSFLVPEFFREIPTPEVVDIALEVIATASRFYLDTDLTHQEALMRLKSLSPEILTDLSLFFHKKGLSFDQDGKAIARTLTEFVNDILIQNGQGSPSDEELWLLFCMDS